MINCKRSSSLERLFVFFWFKKWFLLHNMWVFRLFRLCFSAFSLSLSRLSVSRLSVSLSLFDSYAWTEGTLPLSLVTTITSYDLFTHGWYLHFGHLPAHTSPSSLDSSRKRRREKEKKEKTKEKTGVASTFSSPFSFSFSFSFSCFEHSPLCWFYSVLLFSFSFSCLAFNDTPLHSLITTHTNTHIHTHNFGDNGSMSSNIKMEGFMCKIIKFYHSLVYFVAYILITYLNKHL